MASAVLFKKFLVAFLFFGALPPMAQILQISIGWFPVTISMIMMLVTLAPEIACWKSPDVWKWVREGIEDGDRKLNSNDLGAFLGYYGTFLVLRCFVFGYLFAMVGGWDPRVEILYSPLAFAASGGVLTYISKKRG